MQFVYDKFIKHFSSTFNQLNIHNSLSTLTMSVKKELVRGLIPLARHTLFPSRAIQIVIGLKL